MTQDVKPLQRILEILTDGPATTAEIAEEMGAPLTNTSARLASAWRGGHLAKRPHQPPDGGPVVVLWMLKAHAPAWCAETRDSKK